MLKIGDRAPDFCLKNQDDMEICLEDFAKKRVILYFYPKDNTSGCTIQAKEFSELLDSFMQQDYVVVGVSADSGKSHQNFIQKHQLKIMLLSDADRAVAASYGVYGKKMMYGREVMGIIRSVFVIEDGIIKQALYNVRAKGNAQKVLEMVTR